MVAVEVRVKPILPLPLPLGLPVPVPRSRPLRPSPQTIALIPSRTPNQAAVALEPQEAGGVRARGRDPYPYPYLLTPPNP